MLRNLWRTFLAGFLLLASATAFPQGAEHTDSFDGPDGERPAGWTIFGAIDEAFWQRRGGAFYTGNGDDYEQGVTWAVLDRPGSADWTNYTVGADVRMTQRRGDICIAARWRDVRSHYYAALEAYSAANSDQDVQTRIQIYKVSGGTTRSLAAAGAAEGLLLPNFNSGPDAPAVRLDFQVDGPQLRVLLNGNVMLEASDPEFASGTVALGQDLNDVYFDNLRVTGSFDPNASVPIVAAAIDALPPASTGGTLAWRLLVLEKKSRKFAEDMVRDIGDYPHVEIVPEGDAFSVYVGRYPSSEEATKAAEKLSGEGFLLADVAPRPFTPPGAAPPPTPRATPSQDILPPVTAAPEKSPEEVLAEMARTASELREAGDLEAALDVWYRVKAKAPVGSAMWQLSGESISSINEEIVRRNNAKHDPPPSSGPSMGLIVGIAVGVLVLASIVVFVFMTRAKKKNDDLAKKVKADAKTPQGGTKAPSPALLAPIAVAAPRGTPKAEPTPRPANALEVGPEARIRPGTVSPAPQREPTPRAPVAPPRAEPTPHVSAPRPEPTPRPAPPAPPRKSTEESGVKLDFLFDNPSHQAPPSTPKREDTSEFFEPPAPDAHVPAAEATPPVTASAPPDQAIFYAQDFENEPVGHSPANWKGDYEYAALKVHSEGTGGGSRCLRFEKKNGVGSAYYSCRFPNASGRIGVEFDMRCDDKNKYLLGFYIEKDEDFRQSIHTIVHRTNSNAKPTLRLQNEACNYDFGRWTHIRFEIDLPRHIVDGYVDEKAIAMGTRLNNCPKYVNTLSIRDNLATAGVLLIDNIRIYRL